MGPSHHKGEGFEERAGPSSPISESQGSKIPLLGTVNTRSVLCTCLKPHRHEGISLRVGAASLPTVCGDRMPHQSLWT